MGFLSNFYGNPETHLRSQSWDLLRRIAPHTMGTLWLVFGDFNEALSVDEFQGSVARPVLQMALFRAVIDDLGLQEIKGSSPFFTWNNNIKGDALTWTKLDRVFINFSVCHCLTQFLHEISTPPHPIIVPFWFNWSNEIFLWKQPVDDLCALNSGGSKRIVVWILLLSNGGMGVAGLWNWWAYKRISSINYKLRVIKRRHICLFKLNGNINIWIGLMVEVLLIRN